jgi:histidinol-phosphate aminotransferase
LLKNVQRIKINREQVRKDLEGLGLTVAPSQANFLLFSGFDIPAPILWQKLLDAGVLIRDVGLSGQLRVTIGSEAENKFFLERLTAALQ